MWFLIIKNCVRFPKLCTLPKLWSLSKIVSFLKPFSQVSIVSNFQLLFFPCWVQSPNGRISLVETLQETEVLTNAKATVGIQKFCGRHPLPLCHRLLVLVVVGISFEYIFVVKKYFSDHSSRARESQTHLLHKALHSNPITNLHSFFHCGKFEVGTVSDLDRSKM